MRRGLALRERGAERERLLRRASWPKGQGGAGLFPPWCAALPIRARMRRTYSPREATLVVLG